MENKHKSTISEMETNYEMNLSKQKINIKIPCKI